MDSTSKFFVVKVAVAREKSRENVDVAFTATCATLKSATQLTVCLRCIPVTMVIVLCPTVDRPNIT